ncbi:GNAT superfamily N-acetyltransferase [Paenibacillus amylolyticus]|uniref:GNAT superfamily N-acetyltransferase n=1 Tax=Paenibacillus amylolyticus TaxID=1451 RepID=A0AAP5H1Y2_PAEAM|nr:GNAT family N-acetyltransferase [Paenibacillus amylolyticus]MDR6724770.1 GNAT superfamily N-acetyltransferase [Paenibacillus amylolyticus]
MRIIAATESHYEYIREHDRHIVDSFILPKIRGNEIYMLQNDEDQLIGWMRHSYFWDNTPFMNMIWIDEPYRNRGLGKQAILFWENEMKKLGFELVMTSTLANEGAQHLYRKLGYRDAGGLLLEGEPLEILMTKRL